MIRRSVSILLMVALGGMGCGGEEITEPVDSSPLANPGTQYGAEDVAFSMTIILANPGGSTFAFSDAGTVPAWGTFTDNGDNTAAISGTPLYGTYGKFTVSVTVDDGAVTDTETFDIIIEGSIIETYAGDGVQGQGADGLPPDRTSLYWPQDITFGPDGKAYIVDWNNHRIRVVSNGITQTLIGTGELGDANDGPATGTGLNHPTHVAFSPQGKLILSAWHNSKVMEMDLGTDMMAAVCNPTGARDYGGDGGPAIDALLNLPVACVYDSFGRMYVMDQANQRLRIVENGIIETFAGTGVRGYGGDGGLASDAMFNFPVGQGAWPAGKIDIDKDDNIYIPDTGNHRIRVIFADDHSLPSPGLLPAHTENTIETLAGTGEEGAYGDYIPALDAQLRHPGAVAVGPDGAIYFADTFNHAIRRINSDGQIVTVAGQLAMRGYGGDGGHPRDALLDQPSGVSFDQAGNLYIADRGNNRIRKVRLRP